ncbi:glycerol-3-phosphate 1-O-acyltransferase PlsY [bacterium]|nr:glycerol-3-phosphate 1-O-acyltransferase PlsY [bacterium]
MIYNIIWIMVVAYLLGSVPFGLLIARWAGKGDIRQVGSKSIGATNVMRVGGLRLAGLTWILDMAKAIAAVCLGMYFGGTDLGAWCGVAAIVGHCYPIWLRFHGGKGISSLFGVVLAISPLTFVFSGLEWLAVSLGTGYSSLGAIVVFTLLPLYGFAMGASVGWAFVVMALICLWRHRENIRRLITGTESKITWRWKK